MKTMHCGRNLVSLLTLYALTFWLHSVGATPPELAGNISGVLTQGVYRATSNLIVATNATLTVEPGVVVMFDPETHLIVNGALRAGMPESDPVQLTSSLELPAPGSWGGVLFGSGRATTSSLSNVVISFATTGAQINPGPTFLEGCSVEHASESGVEVYVGPGWGINSNSVRIVGNSIHNNRRGIYLLGATQGCSDSSISPLVEGNQVFDNDEEGFLLRLVDLGGYTCTVPTYARGDGVIIGNLFRGNHVGLKVQSTDGGNAPGTIAMPVIVNNVIDFNRSHGVVLLGAVNGSGAETLNPRVAHNTIIRNGGAGVFHSANMEQQAWDRRFEVFSNLVAWNQSGLEADAPFEVIFAIVSHNNVLENTNANWINYPSEFGRTDNENVNGTPCDWKRNISAHPGFTGADDYQLSAISPCVGAGLDSATVSADYRGNERSAPHDIGAFEASSTLGGDLDGTLGLGVYEVTNTLVIPFGLSLMLPPGIELHFRPDTRLEVFGSLYSLGGAAGFIASNRVALTGFGDSPEPGNWEGVVIHGSESSEVILRHAEIAFAKINVTIVAENGTPLASAIRVKLEDSRVHSAQHTGVLIRSGDGTSIFPDDVTIENNNISDNGQHGVVIRSVAGASASRNFSDILGNRIVGNGLSGVSIQAQNGLIAAFVPSICSPLIAGNTLAENQIGLSTSIKENSFNSMDIGGDVRNNLILSNRQHGIHLSGRLTHYQLSVHHNHILGNQEAGLLHEPFSDPLFHIRNNIFQGNLVGIVADSPYQPPSGAVGYNNVWGNTISNWMNYPLDFGLVTATNQNGSSTDLSMNLSEDSRLLPAPGYQLSMDSPCINAGDGNSAVRVDFEGHLRYEPFDIGSFEFQPILEFLVPPSKSEEGIALKANVIAAKAILLESSTNLTDWILVDRATNVSGQVEWLVPGGYQDWEFFRARPE